jgi:tRNA(Ile)-lysidine synthase
VEAYAAAHHVAFRADASNASDAYLRNRVRHHLLPLLAKEYNPRIVESLGALADLMREDESALTAQATSLLAGAAREVGPAVDLGLAALRAAPPAVARRAFQEAFLTASRGGYALMRRHLEAFARLLTREAVVRLPGGLEARREAAEIRIGPAGGRGTGRILAIPAEGEFPAASRCAQGSGRDGHPWIVASGRGGFRPGPSRGAVGTAGGRS